MIADPTLLNPRRVLHTLSHSSALFVLMALLMDDCPRPCSGLWLRTRAGKSGPTVNGALALLQDGGVVRETRPGYWELTDGVKQLPLPLRFLGQPDVYDGELAPINNQPIIGELTPSNQPVGAGELAPINNQPSVTGGKNFSRGKNFFSHDDDDLIQDQDQELNHHHQSPEAACEKKTFSPVQFLGEIGMNGPYPSALTSAPLPVLLAWWWSAVTNKRISNPPGFVRSRLTSNPPAPLPRPFYTLATAWLQMSTQEREYLTGVVDMWDRGIRATPITGDDLAEHLDPDFYPDLDAAALDALLQVYRTRSNDLWITCG